MSFQNAEVPTNLSSAKGGKLQKQDPAGNKGSEKSFSFVKAFLFKEILTDTSKGFAWLNETYFVQIQLGWDES